MQASRRTLGGGSSFGLWFYLGWLLVWGLDLSQGLVWSCRERVFLDQKMKRGVWMRRRTLCGASFRHWRCYCCQNHEQSRAALDKQIQHTKATVKATEEAFLYRLHVEAKSIISEDDLVHFRGLAMLPRCGTALLEKVAVWSGSRTPRWCKSACEMLAELLFFLHSTRMKEMTRGRVQASQSTVGGMRNLMELF